MCLNLRGPSKFQLYKKIIAFYQSSLLDGMIYIPRLRHVGGIVPEKD